MAPDRFPPAFAEAGRQSGLQVWRIERLELVPVPPSRHGDFFVGDAYLVLRTERRGDNVTYRLHYWLGRSEGSPQGPGLAALQGSRGRAFPPFSVRLRCEASRRGTRGGGRSGAATKDRGGARRHHLRG